MSVVRFVADLGGSLHGGGLYVAPLQELSVCDGRRPFRLRRSRISLLEPKTRRAGLIGVFGLSADGGGSFHGLLHPGRNIGLHPGKGQGRESARPGRRQAGHSAPNEPL